MKVNIHTLYYRVEEYEKTIQKLKEEVEKNKKARFRGNILKWQELL